ncbi:MAG: hydrolase [Candidatus Brocadiaceae bacterium]|nr:hydrolase [Candidatus Brocadiaceae bacterium]
MQATHYKIEEVIEKAESLSYMPTIVLKLMEMISDPDITVHEIVAVIEKDQGLVARIFKVSNSAFYGRLQKAENLTDAVITLGLRGRYDMLEDALVSGLVHDIGKAFIGSVYPEVPSLIQQKIVKDNVTYDEAEQIILDFNHAEIGALITEKWGFPPKIVDVIRYHHNADDIQEVCIESQKMVHLVKLANIMSKQYDALPDSYTEDVFEKLHSAAAFDLTHDRLTYLMEEVKMRWKTEGENGLFY